MPPSVEFIVPGRVEVHEGIVLIIISFIESLVHEVVELIATVEVATSFAWAVGKSEEFANVFVFIEDKSR